MKKIGLLLLAFSIFNSPFSIANAQDAKVSGRVINAPYFDLSRKLQLSQTDNIYGTARSASMAGAFTSLGADLSSMSINPAGLGMYQSSDWGVTASLSMGQTSTFAPNVSSQALRSGGKNTSFAFNNVGFVWNLFNRSKGLTSMSIGFAYNRVADFNQRSYVRTKGEQSSISDMFARQLDIMGTPTNDGFLIKPGQLDSSSDPFGNEDVYLDEFGAVLGYQTGLVGLIGGNDTDGYTYGVMNALGAVDSEFRTITSGGIHEYDVSLGANVSNVVYLGATLGATNVNYKEETLYEETYDGSGVSGMSLDQRTKLRGWGFSAKFGAIVRPIPALRIGIAAHLPTYWLTNKTYHGTMSVDGVSSNTGAELEDNQEFNSAPKLLVGVSGVVGQKLLLAFDYECAWYNRIRDRSEFDIDNEDSMAESNEKYKPGHTFRLGAEFRAHESVSLRVGAAHSLNLMRDKTFVTNNPIPYTSYTLSAGVGFNLGKGVYLDLAYLYNNAKYTDYDFYYHEQGGQIASQYDTVDGNQIARTYTPRVNRHIVSLTFGSRF